MSHQGTVKWFSEEKGYGFITPDDGGPDVFAHHTQVAGTGFKKLHEGDYVCFDVTQGSKGPQANNVIVQGSQHQSGRGGGYHGGY